jgi:hypothetical protein
MTATQTKTAPKPRRAVTEEHELGERRLTALPPGAQGVALKVVSVTGEDILLTFNGIAGNRPSTYGNTAFLWQNGPQIPYNAPPFKSQPVSGNSPSGSIGFSFDVKPQDYVIGYATGPSVKCITSWAYVPPAGDDYMYFQSSTWVNPTDITPDLVIVNYETPMGNNPSGNQAWAGIWKGPSASYTQEPSFPAVAARESNKGRIPIPGTYTRSSQYTVGFFMGAAQTTLAATYTFTT